MFEWITGSTVATGLLAYLGGLATKPIQSLIEERRERNKLQKALYSELSANFNQLFKLRDFLLRQKEAEIKVEAFVGGYVNLDSFEYAKRNPLTFNLLPEANHIKDLYAGFALFVQNSGETDRRELINVCNSQLDALRERLSGNYLDTTLFLGGITPAYQHFFNRLTHRGAGPISPD